MRIKNSLFFIFLLLHIYSNAQNIGPQNSNDTINLQQLTDYVSSHYFSKTLNIEKYTERAIAIAIKLNDKKTLADLYRMAGVIEYFDGKHDKALKYYFDGLKIYERLNNNIGIIRTYNEIGTLYRKNNRIEEALIIFQKAFQLAEKINDTASLAVTMNNTGIVYEVQNNLPKALNYYFKALGYYQLLKDSLGQSYCFENIGGVYLMQKKYSESEKYLLKNYEFRKELKQEQSTAFSLHYLGDLYQQKGNYNKAIKVLEECIAIGTKIQYPDITQRAMYSIAEIEKKKGNYKQAYEFYSKATTIKDSIFDAKSSLQITEMQTLYNVENKNKENLLLKQTVEIEKQTAKNRKLQYGFSILVLFLLIVGGTIYFIRKRQLANIQTQLKINDAEHKQRLRISNDLHDNVGAQLSYVVSNLEISNQEIENNKIDVKRISSITEMSKNAILTLRETVWALNTQSISLESFSDKFKSYTQKMTEFSVNLEVQIKENIKENNILQPNTALHLFRICQESFSNAIKHANATKIIVEIGNDNTNMFYFKLNDNGIGFNIDEAKQKGHYGLQNMQHRAEEVSAQYLLNTSLNNGTQIELNLPFKK